MREAAPQLRDSQAPKAPFFFTWSPKLPDHDLLYHLFGAPPYLNLLLTDLPQLIDGRSLASNNTLRHLDTSANSILPRNSISRRLSSNPDNTNSWVFRSTVMLSIIQISQPRLQGWRVVFLDDRTIGDDLRRTGN